MIDCSLSAWLPMRSLLLVSWVFLVPILLIEEIGVVSGQCLGDQRDLLLQLKNSLNFSFGPDGSDQLAQWAQNSDCCLWHDVRCDKEGHVTGLVLSNKSISGVFDNSSLFNMEHLRSLDLSLNKFDGSLIPARIGNLTNLNYLNLSNAGFGGQIPIEMSKLTRLVTLDISTNPFLQISLLKLENPNLRVLVRNMSGLEELYLDGVNISALGSEWGLALSSSLLNLRALSLSKCYLSGPIDSSLKKLEFLSVIHLDDNKLSSPVPRFFSNFSRLSSLRLGSSRLKGTFPKEIFTVQTLQIIDISNNPFLQGSLPDFPINTSLRSLVLSSSGFTGSLPSSIDNLRNLSVLDLSSCQFSGQLPISIEKLTQLTHVDMSNNSFNGSLPSFNMSRNLTRIIVSHNSLNGALQFVHWDGLNKLVILDLRNNLLNGSIPSSLFALPSLEVVQLSFNKFEAQIPGFQNMSSSLLDTIDLSSNKLEGPIPISMYDLGNLSVLSLSSNNLSDTVQLDHFKSFPNLTTLDLSFNNLTVIASGNYTWHSLPKISTLKLASCKLTAIPNLRNQSKLVHLDLSDNQIGGEVPDWIWELGNGSLQYLNLSHNNLVSMQEPTYVPSFLGILDLHSNRLQGKFPNLPQLATFIDLSCNKFNSSIPPDIGNHLNYTIYFSLSNNSLIGGIPESICNGAYLQVLDLSVNKLSGEVPMCVLAKIQTLGVLNLRRNGFSGPIPDAFPVNCTLETLDLNGNLIDGKIPKSLSRCKKLEVLDLGNNNLTGHFPCLLKNISTLRVLVMRSNGFQGNLGCPNSTGVWEKLQIIDLARNNFTGKIDGRCLTKWKAMRNDDDDSQHKIKHLQFEYLELSSRRYYRDAVTVTLKGREMKLQKILTLFTSIDISCNNFSGPIPQEVGQLGALYILNLSYNAFTGEIPSSIGKLRQLESLDLSRNGLSGVIPATLANLYFLSFLNLSFNQLVGRIPTGTQLQTFPSDSFEGNKALYGFPLTRTCNSTSNPTSQRNAEPSFWSDIEFDWLSIYSGIGFGVGAGAVVALLMLCHEGKYWFEDFIDDALLAILPRLGYSYRPRDEWDNDEVPSLAEDHDETAMEDNDSQGQFCVFCSKLDISMKRAIHDLNCICHSSPPMSSSSRSSSLSSSSLP